MSGYADDAILRHGLVQAEMVFIQKPFTAPDLFTRIRELLDVPTGDKPPIEAKIAPEL